MHITFKIDDPALAERIRESARRYGTGVTTRIRQWMVDGLEREERAREKIDEKIEALKLELQRNRGDVPQI